MERIGKRKLSRQRPRGRRLWCALLSPEDLGARELVIGESRNKAGNADGGQIIKCLVKQF